MSPSFAIALVGFLIFMGSCAMAQFDLIKIKGRNKWRIIFAIGEIGGVMTIGALLI